MIGRPSWCGGLQARCQKWSIGASRRFVPSASKSATGLLERADGLFNRILRPVLTIDYRPFQILKINLALTNCVLLMPVLQCERRGEAAGAFRDSYLKLSL